MGSWTHDPALNYSYSLLQNTGLQQYDTGKDTVAKGIGDFTAPTEHFKRLLSGDLSSILGEIGPQIDPITQQFSQVRRMISDQPRGGGKTSELAALPVENIRMISNLINNARSGAATGLSDIAGRETSAGLTQTGMGLGAAESAANIAAGGRNTDIQNSWKSFFKNLAGQAVMGLGEGAGGALMKHFL